MIKVPYYICFSLLVCIFSGCSILKKPFFIKNKKKEERKEKREEKKIEKDIAKGKIDSTEVAKRDSIILFPTDTLLARSFFSLRTIDFKTFQARAKMHYEGEDRKQNFTANFRLLKDKIIWVSITAFEIEAARALITPDSVKFIDRLNKKSHSYSYSELQNLINLEVDFETLQQLIVGNAVATKGTITDVKNIQEVLTTFIKGEDYMNQITFTKSDTLLKQILLQTQRPISTSSIMISYSNYSNENGSPFSTIREINVQDIKGASSLNVEYKKFEFDKELEFPYSVPSSYTNHNSLTLPKQ